MKGESTLFPGLAAALIGKAGAALPAFCFFSRSLFRAIVVASCARQPGSSFTSVRAASVSAFRLFFPPIFAKICNPDRFATTLLLPTSFIAVLGRRAEADQCVSDSAFALGVVHQEDGQGFE
jgi:hypothetical protein